MSISLLCIYVVSLAAVSIVLARGEIFDPLKLALVKRIPRGIEYPVMTFVYCSMCIGFWVGFINAMVTNIPMLGFMFHDIMVPVVMGSLVSVTAIAIDHIIWKRQE